MAQISAKYTFQVTLEWACLFVQLLFAPTWDGAIPVVHAATTPLDDTQKDTQLRFFARGGFAWPVVKLIPSYCIFLLTLFQNACMLVNCGGHVSPGKHIFMFTSVKCTWSVNNSVLQGCTKSSILLCCAKIYDLNLLAMSLNVQTVRPRPSTFFGICGASLDWPIRNLSRGWLLSEVKEVPANPIAYDTNLASKLWTLSADIANLPVE